MIAKIAVSAATFAIDKPYSYLIPEGMTLQPGQRVQLPFGRANRRCEGLVLFSRTSSCGLRPFCGNGISAPFMMPSGRCFRQDCGFRQKRAFP